MRAPAYSRQLVLAMAGSFAVALLIAATVLAILGTGERALFIALRATARWSFLLFWLAYVAGPSRAVFGARLTPLAVLGRPLGLSFASAHLVHVSLVVWLYRVSTEPPVPQSSLIFFGIGVFWTYLLVLLSLPLFWRFLGSRASRVLLHLGVNYILLAFLIDFMKPTPRHDALTELLYLPFVTLCLFAAGLRIFWVGRAAWPLSRHLWSRLQRASRRM